MTTTPPAGLLAMLTGGAGLTLPTFPCAYCLADPLSTSCGDGPVPEPEPAVTIVAGTLVCADHAWRAVETIDRGNIAEQLGQLVDQAADANTMLDNVRRSLDVISGSRR